MSWFPSFLNPFAAAIAAAVVIPALLVLYFLKLRRREMPVSSTLLWRKAIQDLQVNAPFQKLRKNLLLLLQLLLLLLLVLALSRPVANYTPGAGQSTIIIIDRSASMSARDIDGGKKTRLEEAKRRAIDLIDSMKKDATAMVIAMDDMAEIKQTPTTDQRALRAAVESIRPGDRKSRLKTAYQFADAQTQFDPEQLRVGGNVVMPGVHVFSDGRTLDDASEVSVRGDVTYEKIGSDDAKNVGVVSLSARRNYERPTDVQVFARLANYGPEPVRTTVLFTINDKPVEAKVPQMTLLPERWTDEQRTTYEKEHGASGGDSVDLPIELLDAAVVKVEQMDKEGDVLAADDVAAVVVPPPKNLSVLLVTDGNYFLERALKSQPLKDPATMNPVEYEQKAPKDFDVVLFDRYQPQFVPPAGAFIYFGAVPAKLKLKQAVDEAGVALYLDDVGVLDWRRDHPILKNLAMGKLYVAQAIKMDVPIDSEVLLDGLKCPLIALHREGKGIHLVVAFDLLQSNWPLKVSFPIFLNQALQFMAVGGEMNLRQSYEPGATPVIPRAFLQRLGDDVKQIKLTGPAGTQAKPIPPAGDVALPALERVGVYTTDPPMAPFDRMAVNLLDPTESNTFPAATVPGGAAEVREGAAAKSRVELWWWIVACAALPLLLIEWWVYTRRVHL
jgi:hypothetical protein